MKSNMQERPLYTFTTEFELDPSSIFPICNVLSSKDIALLKTKELFFTSDKKHVWLIADITKPKDSSYKHLSDYILIESDTKLKKEEVMKEVFSKMVKRGYKGSLEQFLEECLSRKVIFNHPTLGMMFSPPSSDTINEILSKSLTMPCYIKVVGDDILKIQREYVEDMLEDADEEEIKEVYACLDKAPWKH